jgi:hypothetical protein
MILACHWRAEEGHNSITHEMVDGAFVLMDRIDHLLEYCIEQSSSVLRVTTRQNFKRALDIREQHSHPLALWIK